MRLRDTEEPVPPQLLGLAPPPCFLCFPDPYWPPPPSSWKSTCGPKNVTPRTHGGPSHPLPDTPVPGQQGSPPLAAPHPLNGRGSCIFTPASNLEVLLFRTAQTEVVVFEADDFSLLPPSISKMPDTSKQILWSKSRKWSSELQREQGMRPEMGRCAHHGTPTATPCPPPRPHCLLAQAPDEAHVPSK